MPFCILGSSNQPVVVASSSGETIFWNAVISSYVYGRILSSDQVFLGDNFYVERFAVGGTNFLEGMIKSERINQGS